jgi:hypothetical protein
LAGRTHEVDLLGEALDFVALPEFGGDVLGFDGELSRGEEPDPTGLVVVVDAVESLFGA